MLAAAVWHKQSKGTQQQHSTRHPEFGLVLHAQAAAAAEHVAECFGAVVKQAVHTHACTCAVCCFLSLSDQQPPRSHLLLLPRSRKHDTVPV
jgi:hypothetical protein